MSFAFSNELDAQLAELGITIKRDGVVALDRYYIELTKWKKKVNLIAKSAKEIEIVEKHFVDCLALVPFLQKDNAHLLDIGTGGGFPGLVCKAALPELRLTLVEPRLKRVSFLRHIVRTLTLGGVEIFARRLEEVPGLCQTAFTHITCRAVTEIGPFLEMVTPLSTTGAELVLMKGPRWREELEESRAVLDKSPYKYKNVVEYRLPVSKVQRALIFFEVA